MMKTMGYINYQGPKIITMLIVKHSQNKIDWFNSKRSIHYLNQVKFTWFQIILKCLVKKSYKISIT